MDNEDVKKIISEKISINEDGSHNEKHLQMMVASAIKSHLSGDSSNGPRYTKSYTKRIDNMRTLIGYQSSKFLLFDGKGNPKQHVAHFVETCSEAGTEGDLLIT